MLVVVGLVLAQDLLQMILVPDEGAVQKLAAASANPSFGDRVHAGRPDFAEHSPDPGVGEDCVERTREFAVAVADHESDPVRLVADIHDQVAGLLGGPFPGGMQRDAEDPDAPGRVLYYGEDIGLSAVEQVGREEVARQDRLGLGTQELRPGRPGAPRRGVDSGVLQDLPHCRRRYLHAQSAHLAVDSAMCLSRAAHARGRADHPFGCCTGGRADDQAGVQIGGYAAAVTGQSTTLCDQRQARMCRRVGTTSIRDQVPGAEGWDLRSSQPNLTGVSREAFGGVTAYLIAAEGDRLRFQADPARIRRPAGTAGSLAV